MKRFQDELDAVQAGDCFIKSIKQQYGKDKAFLRTENNPGRYVGGIVTLWYFRRIIAYYVVVRDEMNYTILIEHDLRMPGVIRSMRFLHDVDERPYGYFLRKMK